MRLIDKDQLIKKLRITEDCERCEFADSRLFCTRTNFVDACESICEAEEIDAVKVVRCKDCKHWITVVDRKSGEFGFCDSLKSLTGVTPKDGYCYRAERIREQNEADL